MRASLVLLVVVGIFACGQAQFDLKDIGIKLVNTLVSKLKDTVISAGQKLLGSLLEKFGKRDLGHLKNLFAGLAQKFGEIVGKGKQLAKDAFGKAIDRLRDISNKFHAKLGLLKDSKEATDAVDDAVAEHNVMHRRILTDLFNKGKELLGTVVETLKGLGSALREKASGLVSSLLQKGTDLFIGKRATLSDHLKSIGSAISNAVSPFKDIIAGLGTTLRGHFSNLVNTVKGHVGALKDKLSGHVTDLTTHGKTLLEHGKNAIGALSEVVSDILKQTLNNAKPAIDALSKTAIDAAHTALKHFTGAGSGTF